ncbi:probable E3 ubiquitin-protein ligase makorin-2 isoform X1 [Trachemys scripta elegans]|uniref:probable E3 ubiquitin-protein ligase makorin-2 isoform X1 n=1 Tax=Trachemys scripta elegans TaxID=31138 RepID=UPI001551E9DB|nr:probable E3 ubiquitin-protein ligase makorin-2 isoform X1 [Trachemys scripta elegans]
MEPGSLVAAGGGQPNRGPYSRVLCRNFARGACRWGQNCRFSHDRKSAQICRYFQNGFCGYGDRCSYQHIQDPPAPAWSRCGSQPALSLSRRGSEPAVQPEAAAGSWGGARRGSEPSVPSVTQLQLNFRQLSTEFEEEEEDKETVPTYPPNGAVSREFVPRQAPRGSGSRPWDLGLQRTSLAPEAASNKAIVPAPRTLEAAGGLGAAAASVGELRSEDVVCGICMDKVYEKALPEERVFGILPNCSHAYCVGCIRKWRKSREFQNAVIKACPECRVTSSYFIPHKYWVSNRDEKEKLIETFKARTGKIKCKFFAHGRGRCPFKSECIYLHELPARVRPPRQRPPCRTGPVAFNPSPSESSEEEEDDDVCLFPWALTFALLRGDIDDPDYCHEIFLLDSSDSD